MRTWPVEFTDGIERGFYVPNLLLSRRAVAKIVRRIAGAVVLREQKPMQWTAYDDFCHFTLDGVLFMAIEEYGDNSRYLVMTEVGAPDQFRRVKAEFEAHRPFRIFG